MITIYPRWQIDGGQWVSYLPLLAVVVILPILWLKREPWSHACFFAFAYFIVALLPILGLIDNYIFRYSLVFDHFQYLASIGPLALAGTALARFSNFVIPKKPWLQSSFGAGLLLILGTTSWQRTLVYESQGTLWTDTLVKNPKAWVGLNNLGLVFIQKGQIDKGLEQLQQALKINPSNEVNYSNLGLALVQKGQLGQAILQYQKAIEINSNDAEVRNSLGLALVQNGQRCEAIDQYQKALEINPSFTEVHNNLGLAFLQKGQLNEAMNQFRKALEINPNFAEAHQNLGVALGQKGQLDEAITQFQEVLRLKPDYRPAKDNLEKAQAFVQQRDGYK